MAAEETSIGAQVFAARGRSRPTAMRIVLVAGALVIAAWVAALGLGAFGGFDSLPRPDLSLDERDSPGSTRPLSPEQAVPATAAAPRDVRRPAVSPSSTGGTPSPPSRAPTDLGSVTAATTGGIAPADDAGAPGSIDYSEPPRQVAPGDDDDAFGN
jgi:hypothetical protein